MKIQRARIVRLLLIVFVVTAVQAQPKSDSSVFGVFSGSSPSGDAIRPFLGIPLDAIADLIEWRLTLHQDAVTHVPATYRLHCEYGPAVAGLPGLGGKRSSVERQGSWRIGKGTKPNPEAAVVYELDGSVSLFRLTPDILHTLNRDRSLMIGTGGWSYTLYREGTSEKPGDASFPVGGESRSYAVAPVPTDRSLFGVFDGRSPCQGIARELGIGVSAGCIKVKWRITLWHDPQTKTPTRYRMEDSLHRRAPREGNWTIIRGTQTEPNAIIYRLAPTETEAALFLLRGDDDVLFFLDRNLKPLIGHGEFSYTLNRKQSP